MDTNHYVVSQRESAWQYSHRGEISGPYDTKQKAIDAAIAGAKQAGDADAEVLVRDADLKTESVWRSGSNKTA